MRYLLDTDVISQYQKASADPKVDAWMQRTKDIDLYISDITYAELWQGIELLPVSRRRLDLEKWVENGLYAQFFNRVVTVDLAVCRNYGRLMARAKKQGHNPGAMDTLIAALAVTNSMTVATLNRKDFQHLGVDIVDF